MEICSNKKENKMNKEYWTIAQALEWLTFRGKELNMHQEMEKERLISRYSKILRAALCSEDVAVYGCKSPKAKHKKVAIYPHCYLDYQNNSIAFDPERTRVWVGIQIDAVALREFFLAPQPGDKEKPQPKRCSGMPHDLAFYLFEDNKNLSAKELTNAVCEALAQYPKWENAKKPPVTPPSMGKWLSEFKQKKYEPARTREEIRKQLPGVFAKLNAALK